MSNAYASSAAEGLGCLVDSELQVLASLFLERTTGYLWCEHEIWGRWQWRRYTMIRVA